MYKFKCVAWASSIVSEMFSGGYASAMEISLISVWQNFLYPMLQCRVLNQKFCRTRWQHKDQLWHWASLWPSFCKNLESASSSLLRHIRPYSAVFYMESSDSFSSPAQSPASNNEIYVEPEAHSFICLSQFLNHSWEFTSSPRLPTCLHLHMMVTQLKRGLICWFHFMLLQLGSL